MILSLIALTGSAKALGPENCVRLHVLAESDSRPDQVLKLEVRDACLTAARALLEDCPDADEAWRRVCGGLDVLEAAARQRALDCGWTGPVRAEAGVFSFPQRSYGDVTVPAGEYRALRVVIGSGQGHNWWCVLYPSLCAPEAQDLEAPERFCSSILNWLRALFGGGT